ncbi:hypothetical protein [Pseudomonas fragi]|uniref:hypothetical protein n=1 Tax=Pseudomonas fragi TaxID=296 RepID=UPI000B4C9B8A|nr:hypothetical protein [Pseudomonas fragi]ASC86847.1 hypothetical protein CDA60_11100 [Pseudomonas fragi]
MAKPNYNFAKRQRDLAKEQKKEEKAARKKAAAEGGIVETELDHEVDSESADAAEDTGAPEDKAPTA